MKQTGRSWYRNQEEETYEEFQKRKEAKYENELKGIFSNIRGSSLKEEDKINLIIKLKDIIPAL